MKSREVKLIRFIKEKTGIDFTLCEEEFSPYDAYNNDYIVELKIRKVKYKTKAIEVGKCYNLEQIAQVQSKKALYIVGDLTGIYIFNITDKIKDLLSMKIERIKMPNTTESSNKVMINKYVYMLPNEMSKKISLM
jgi:hypothetical protein